MELNSASQCLMVAGVYDGLSAKIAEIEGFDAIWASGFSISASKGLPDNNSLSVEQLVDRVNEIRTRVSIPIVVDCDEGYGSIETTLDLIRNLVALNVQAVCLEDNQYPKINSFFPVSQRNLASKKEFSAKLRCIRSEFPHLALIARTEALIAGKTLVEAIERATAYADSGSDYVVIHNRYTTLDEYQLLASMWNNLCPLIVIPTTAINIQFDDFSKLGFAMVIYANHALRAATRVVIDILQTLRNSGRQSDIVSELVSMNDIYELTNLSNHENNDQV